MAGGGDKGAAIEGATSFGRLGSSPSLAIRAAAGSSWEDEADVDAEEDADEEDEQYATSSATDD